MKLIRTGHLRKFIVTRYHNIPEDRFLIVKISMRIYMYIVTKECKLKQEPIYFGQLSAVNTKPYLLQHLKNNIEAVLKKYDYL